MKAEDTDKKEHQGNGLAVLGLCTVALIALLAFLAFLWRPCCCCCPNQDTALSTIVMPLEHIPIKPESLDGLVITTPPPPKGNIQAPAPVEMPIAQIPTVDTDLPMSRVDTDPIPDVLPATVMLASASMPMYMNPPYPRQTVDEAGNSMVWLAFGIILTGGMVWKIKH